MQPAGGATTKIGLEGVWKVMQIPGKPNSSHSDKSSNQVLKAGCCVSCNDTNNVLCRNRIQNKTTERYIFVSWHT